MNLLPNFLKYERLMNFKDSLFSQPMYMSHFALFNIPLFYTIYNNTFDIYVFAFSYFTCGILQGVINSILYYVSDILFFGKPINTDEWKATKFYDLVVYNTDATYLYVIGSMAYSSMTVIPEKMQWTLVYPGFTISILQLLQLCVLHDIFFTFIHYTVHKIESLRISHLKWHHECPFHIGSSRCAIATEGIEGLFRDLYSATIPTYIISFFGQPFYGYNWLLYYSVYSFWAMYIHTGVNVYHKLHHMENSRRNFGLYYISDYVLGTLVLNDKEN
jgi:hypothetical protein